MNKITQQISKIKDIIKNKLIMILFIIFGLFAIIFPNGFVNNMSSSYTVPDLIRGWGIYSVTIGLLLYSPSNINKILLLCFIISILWHIELITRLGITNHHKESIIINMIAILIVL